jgi:hypothetical protein
VAFALGVLAIAALLRERRAVALALVGAAAAFHPTTALWFAIWVGTAIFVSARSWRAPLAAAALATALALAWAVSAGPLAGRLAPMDLAWLATIASKDYLFPTDWPLEVWILNLALPVIVLTVYAWRRRLGLAHRAEHGLVAGAVALLAVFFLTLPFNAARIALVVQLQIPRLFWMLDLLATIYAAWALVEAGRTSRLRGALVTMALLVAAAARGYYSLEVRYPDRDLFETRLEASEWTDVMAWASRSEPGSYWLADPGHAWRYGASVRLAGRDVFLEAVKDEALAMYSRDVAQRVADHTRALGDFHALSADRARSLAARYDLDYLVTERELPLPVAYRNRRFVVYRLAGAMPPAHSRSEPPRRP